MNLILRLLSLSVFSVRGVPASPLGPCRTEFRVWPTDLDVLGHVNNGKYLSLMDLARVDLLNRAGLSAMIRARGWYPVVVAENIAFRRSLTLFQRFEIRTEVIGWDDKAFYITQDFEHNRTVVASALVKARFLAREGERVQPQSILNLAGLTPEQPPLPTWVTSAFETRLITRK